jgi:tetratricopeptide (TPR) repeat protein
VAGIAVAELVDALRSGLDHPLLDAVVGGLLGAVVGKAAVQFYSEAMKPLAVRAYNGLGDAYRQTGEISRARQSYAQALNLSPDDAGTLQRLASVAQAT